MHVPGRVIPARAATLEQFRTALAKASAVVQVLEIAVAELETQEDEHTLANVVTFATNFSVRQAASIHTTLSGTP